MFRKILKKIFGIHRPSKEWVNVPSTYVERDTECDLCTYEKKDECDLIDVTSICDENAKCSCIIEEIQQYIYKDEEEKLSHSKAMEIYGFEDVGQVKTNLGDIHHPKVD